jgi:hypothetical protein
MTAPKKPVHAIPLPTSEVAESVVRAWLTRHLCEEVASSIANFSRCHAAPLQLGTGASQLINKAAETLATSRVPHGSAWDDYLQGVGTILDWFPHERSETYTRSDWSALHSDWMKVNDDLATVWAAYLLESTFDGPKQEPEAQAEAQSSGTDSPTAGQREPGPASR